MIIEFSGLPGAGKSSVCRNLAERLRAGGVRVNDSARAIGAMPAVLRIPARTARAAAFCMLHPARAAGLARLVHRSGQRSRRDSASMLLNALFVASFSGRRNAGRAGRRRIVLLDQGGVQLLASLLYRAQKDAALLREDPTGRLFRFDRLVHIAVAPEEAARRLAGRPGARSRVERPQAAGVAASLSAYGEALRHVLETPQVKEKTATVEGGGKSLEETVAEIEETVRKEFLFPAESEGAR